jgi:hypothetical protein
MKTRPHEQLLFHWIGRDIERDFPGTDQKSREARADRYVSHLTGSLDKGLWVKHPDSPESLLSDRAMRLPAFPLACFTEWRPDESRAHVAKYGKLGLGFPRNWVSKRGGQPVTYVQHAKASRFNKALEAVTQAISTYKGDVDAERHLSYILHFAKPIRDGRQRTVQPTKSAKPAARPARSHADPFRRSFGEAMPYVAEREWRIVGPDAEAPRGVERPKYFETAPNGARAQFYLPYDAGRELFTVVLPDNLTMNRVLCDARLRAWLFPQDGPHVTLLSLEDVGSF